MLLSGTIAVSFLVVSYYTQLSQPPYSITNVTGVDTVEEWLERSALELFPSVECIGEENLHVLHMLLLVLWLPAGLITAVLFDVVFLSVGYATTLAGQEISTITSNLHSEQQLVKKTAVFKKIAMASSESTGSTQIHVRGIGMDGWNGDSHSMGIYENEEALSDIFGQFGQFIGATIRHRVEDGPDGKAVNTSWALVTMGSTDGVDRALAAAEVKAGKSKLVLNRELLQSACICIQFGSTFDDLRWGSDVLWINVAILGDWCRLQQENCGREYLLRSSFLCSSGVLEYT